MTATPEPSRGAPGPVHRAFGLLQTVVASPGPVGVRELARRTGQPKSTVARLLGILEDLGMVERTPTGEAFGGSALATLQRDAPGPSPLLRDRLRPLLLELVDTFGETASLGVDDGDRFLYLAAERGPSAIQVPDPTGRRYLFHTIAPGLAAMATWPEARLSRYLSAPLAAPTPFTITDPTALRARLARATSDGYVWTDQELDLEVNGVAVPVADGSGNVVGFVSLYGPAYRLSPTLTADIGPALQRIVAARTALPGS